MEVDASPEGASHISSFMNLLKMGAGSEMEAAQPCNNMSFDTKQHNMQNVLNSITLNPVGSAGTVTFTP
jgi:hypothetical protein